MIPERGVAYGSEPTAHRGRFLDNDALLMHFSETSITGSKDTPMEG
jgi:hypothetical protein